MDISLQEACREARKRLGLTSQDLSDASGIPVSTINNFFANGSKRAALAIAGPLCCALHVSIDRIFGITEILPPDQQLAQMQQQHTAELRTAHLEGRMESMQRRIKTQNLLIFIMAATLSVVIVMLGLYVALDFRAAGVGLIRNGSKSTFAWAVVLLLTVGVGVIAVVLLSALHYARKHAPLNQE